MDSIARYRAARRLLRDLDEEIALRENPLLGRHAAESHDRLRARVLRAVESLDPGLAATTPSERRYRLYQILVLCDLNGKSHKEVAATLGISRRQFYVDRRAAFLLVADALEKQPAEPRIHGPSADALSMHLDYMQMLQEQGRFDAVCRESLSAVREMRGHAREVEMWNMATEASRLLGNIAQSLEAMDRMSRAAASSEHGELRRASAMRIAISDIGLQQVQGDIDAALARFDKAVEDSGNERTMYGRDATLFAILLGYGAELCIESGRWQRAEALVRRAERIIDRSEQPFANARQQRLRARIAQDVRGDFGRAALELQDALKSLQQHKQLPAIARGAVEYGVALAEIDRGEAMKYIRHGLTMAHDVCGQDQFAVLFSKAAPLLIESAGADVLLREAQDLRRQSRLSKHADLLLGVAEADARLARGDFEATAQTAADLGVSLEDAALYPSAAKARLITVEAFARAGWIAKARHLLKKSREFVRAYGDHATRRRLERTALFLHS